MNRGKIMMLFFVGSEAFFFLALIISYVYYSHPGGDLSSTAKYLDIAKTTVFSVLLFTSSLTIWLAELGMRKGRRNATLGWLAATILLGLVFLIGQGNEYAGLIGMDVTISKNVFGSAFFTLTGFHGLHVFLGLIVLTVMGLMLRSGRFHAVESTAFDSVAIYWHFVDAVWVVVFSVVYIGAFL